MVKDILQKFADTDLYSASLTLLGEVGVKINQETCEPIQVSDFYEKGMPKYLKNALSLIKDTYFLGVVNDETLANETPAVQLYGERQKVVSSQGKYEGMFVFAMDVKSSMELRRSDVASLTRSLNRIAYAVPVILIVREGHFLSLATCERTEYTQEWRNAQGEKLGKVSILRNVDCLHPHRGHLDILESLGSKSCSSFDDLYKHWMDVFSSELLTKKFYLELFDWYQWAINPESKVSFPDDADTQDDDRQDIDTKIIRLITRLMFVWFIKQKGLVPSQIFEASYISTILKEFDAQSSTVGNYYQAVLQNLFFGTLNRPILEDGVKRGFAKATKIDLRNLYRYGRDEEGGLFSISDEEVVELFANVPYLNCGLFECQDKCKQLDGVSKRYYHDGFSRNPAKFKDGTYRYRAVVPNVLFFHPQKGLLAIFNRYVFTIEENTPQDVLVALDPELLGKVFENLLGAYNPETRETARNQSGSFYTPREIVQFMVNESLVAHLKATVDASLEVQYRQLLDFTTEDIALTKQQKEAIVHSIFTCKVLDPACGSGAFPMGMLQQMVHILRQVDPDNTQWRGVLMNMALEESRHAFGIQDESERKEKLREIEETFDNGLNLPDYTRKLYIIESCIYGVDIQPIAMLITRLRFFITLVSEQKDIQRDRPDINFGIKTLPNLESKFVAADSLISADIHKYNEDWTQNEELTRMKNELLAIRRRHFYTRKRGEKVRLLKEDEAKREEIHAFIRKLVGEPNMEKIEKLNHEIAKLQKEVAQYQGENWVEEFVAQPMDLFDQNPQVKFVAVDKNKSERSRINTAISQCEHAIEIEKNKCLPQGFEAAVLQVTDWNPYDQNTVSKFLDIEWMFGLTTGFDIVIGNPPYIQLQNEGGKLAKKYEACGYGTYARTGDIYCIFYERGSQLLKANGHLCYITSNKWMRAGYGEKTRGFFAKHTNPQLLIDFAGVKIFESATVDTNILLFSKAVNEHKTFCVVMNKQNKDSIKNLSDFVQQNGSVCEFVNTDSWVILSPIEQSIKRKIESVGTPLKDWDINIYRGVLTGCNEAFIISTEKRDEILDNCATEDERQRTAELIRPILRGRDIKRYGYNWANLWLINTHNGIRGKLERIHIEDYPAVKAHLDQYWDKISKRADKGETPYNLRNCAYLEDFSKPKIIYPNMTKYMPFVFIEECYLTNQKCFIITGELMPYLTAFFNSSIFKFCFRDSFPELQGGTRELSKIFFDKIPVKKITKAENDAFYDAIKKLQSNYTRKQAEQIDSMLFDLYNLTDLERETIGYIEIS